MARREFWEVIKDDDTKTYEILGLSSDDTRLTDMVFEMQQVGMHVRCETIPASTTRAEIDEGYRHIDYKPEEGLYRRLRSEYHRRKSQRSTS